MTGKCLITHGFGRSPKDRVVKHPGTIHDPTLCLINGGCSVVPLTTYKRPGMIIQVGPSPNTSWLVFKMIPPARALSLVHFCTSRE